MIDVNITPTTIAIGISVGLFLFFLLFLLRRKKKKQGNSLLELEKLILEGSIAQKQAYEKMAQIYKIIKKAQQKEGLE